MKLESVLSSASLVFLCTPGAQDHDPLAIESSTTELRSRKNFGKLLREAPSDLSVPCLALDCFANLSKCGNLRLVDGP